MRLLAWHVTEQQDLVKRWKWWSMMLGRQVLTYNSKDDQILHQLHLQLSIVLDQHMTGLMTSYGFSLKYKNHYGCIKNVTVTTDIWESFSYIDTVYFKSCKNLSGEKNCRWWFNLWSQDFKKSAFNCWLNSWALPSDRAVFPMLHWLVLYHQY